MAVGLDGFPQKLPTDSWNSSESGLGLKVNYSAQLLNRKSILYFFEQGHCESSCDVKRRERCFENRGNAWGRVRRKEGGLTVFSFSCGISKTHLSLESISSSGLTSFHWWKQKQRRSKHNDVWEQHSQQISKFTVLARLWKDGIYSSSRKQQQNWKERFSITVVAIQYSSVNRFID